MYVCMYVCIPVCNYRHRFQKKQNTEIINKLRIPITLSMSLPNPKAESKIKGYV